MFKEFGDRYGEASTLSHFGHLHDSVGKPALANEAWQQARIILGELDPPTADQIRTQLSPSASSVLPSAEL
jgi:hypothetical protein